MDRFDTPGAPTTRHIGSMKLPPVLMKWMSPEGHAEFTRMVIAHGYTGYEIDSLGIGSITAACCDALYDSIAEDEIKDTISKVAESVAEAHLDQIELIRERNEYRACLKMPPLALPVERELERNPGMTQLRYDGCDEYDTCDGCEFTDCPTCAQWETDDEDESYDDF